METALQTTLDKIRNLSSVHWLAMLAIALAVGMIPRIALLSSVSELAFLHNDGDDYKDISAQLYAGNGFSVSKYRWFEAVPESPAKIHPDFSRPPLLPLVGAALFALPLDWIVSAKILCAAIGAMSIVLVFIFGALLFDKAVALLGCFVFSLCPFGVYYTASWSTENLFLVFVLASLCFAAKGLKGGGRVIDFICCGAAAALAILARPTGVVIVPLLLLLAAWGSWRRIRFALPAFLLALGLTLAPWACRNWIQGGKPTPVTFFGPYIMAIGMNDCVYEMYRNWDSPDFQGFQERIFTVENNKRVVELAAMGVYSMPDAERFWRQWCIEYMKVNPKKAAFIVAARFKHYWSLAPNRTSTSKTQRLASLAFVSFLYVFSLAGLTLAGWKDRRILLLVCIVMLGLAICLPFCYTLRYRYPLFSPYMSLLASYGVFALGAWLAEKNCKRDGVATPNPSK